MAFLFRTYGLPKLPKLWDPYSFNICFGKAGRERPQVISVLLVETGLLLYSLSLSSLWSPYFLPC